MGDKHVIVYEQDDKFTKALKLYFRGSAFDPTTVQDKDALLAAAANRAPDVFLVAIENDDAAARGLIETISTSDPTTGRPIVVMSTKKEETALFAEGVGSVGASAYIKKPFIKKAILRLLDDVMSGAPVPAPKPSGSKDVSMGDVLGDVEAAVDDFFDKEQAPGGEFTLSFEDGDTTAAEDDDIAISLEDDDPGTPLTVGDQNEETPTKSETTAPMEMPSGSGEGKPGELNRLRRRIRALEDELSKKSIEFKAAAREKEKLEKGLGKKESELVERIRTIEKQNEDLEEDIKKRKQLVGQMTASVTQLNEDLEERDQRHEKELNEIHEQTAGVQKQLEDLQEQAAHQSHEIEDKNEEIARGKRQIGDLEGERDELLTGLEQMTKNRDHLDHDLNTERARVDAGRKRFEDGAAELRRQLDSEIGRVKETIERGLVEAREGMQRTRQAIEQSLTQADEAMAQSVQVIGEGLAGAETAVNKGSETADHTLREGIDALTGKH